MDLRVFIGMYLFLMCIPQVEVKNRQEPDGCPTGFFQSSGLGICRACALCESYDSGHPCHTTCKNQKAIPLAPANPKATKITILETTPELDGQYVKEEKPKLWLIPAILVPFAIVGIILVSVYVCPRCRKNKRVERPNPENGIEVNCEEGENIEPLMQEEGENNIELTNIKSVEPGVEPCDPNQLDK